MKIEISRVKMLTSIAGYFYTLAMRCTKERNIVGIPYQRDPDNSCETYEPYTFKHKVTITFNDCETDGHYLCHKCIHKQKGI